MWIDSLQVKWLNQPFKIFPQSLGPDDFTEEFYLTFNKKLITNPSQTFPEGRRREKTFQLILWGSITWYQDQRYYRKTTNQ